MVLNKLQQNRGFSLVEILIVSAIMLVVFGGLLVSFRYSLELISHSRAKLTALTLANDGMEYIRSLSYNAVGTVSGIPSGLIPQVSTTSLNGIAFTKRVLVEYIDDDADGIGGADSNGITTDYKQAKVTLEWTLRGVTKEVFLVTNIIPRSIETDVGGGTVRVNVFDSNNIPLPGALVRLFNTTLVPTIDVTRSSDATGVALFGGAPAGGNYEIVATAPGYSIDQTYRATTSLPNPTTQPIGVVEASISTMNFFIDQLSSLTVTALLTKVPNQFTEIFSDTTGIATSTNASVSSGDLVLSGTPGSYNLNGAAYLNEGLPVPIAGWDYLLVEGIKSVNTNILVRLYTGSSSAYTLIPDSALAGNSAGFTVGGFDLSALDEFAYPGVTLGVTLSSTNSNETPRVNRIVLGYIESATPFANRSLVLTGIKNIGTLADASFVYKTVISTTTNIQGLINLSNIEADNYSLTTSGYDTSMVCSPAGLTVSPGASTSIELLFTTDSVNSLRVVVASAGGTPVIGGQVVLQDGPFSAIKTTSSCGQVFFSGLASSTDYTLDVSAAGYTTQNLSNIDVSGDKVKYISL